VDHAVARRDVGLGDLCVVYGHMTIGNFDIEFLTVHPFAVSTFIVLISAAMTLPLTTW